MDLNRKILLFLTGIFLVCGFSRAASAQSVYPLEQDRRLSFSATEDFYGYGYSPMEKQFSAFLDVGRQLSPDSAWQLNAGAWVAADSIVRRSNWQEAVVWLRGRITGDTAKQQTYAFQVGEGRQTWRNIDVYALYPNGDTLVKRTGSALPPGEKDVRDAFSFFTLPVPAGDTVDLLLRLAGTRFSDLPERISLSHVDTSSMHEWNGYRVQSDYRYEFSPVYGDIIDYALRSVEFLPESPDEFYLGTIRKDSIWDEQGQFNGLEDFDAGRAYWIRQRLIGEPSLGSTHTFLVGRDAQHTWTKIELYVPGRDGRLEKVVTGSKVPPKEKPVHDVHNFFEVFVPAGDTVTVYALLQTELPQLAPSSFYLTHFNRDAYAEKGTNIRYWNGLFQGALWIQLFFSLLLFYIIREWRELYYAALILGMQLFFMGQHGYDLTLRYLLPTLPEWWHPLMNLGSFIALFGLLKFTQTFLNLPELYPRSRMFINIYLGLLGLVSLMGEFFSAGWILQTWRLATAFGILLPLVLAVMARLKQHSLAGIFLLAVSFFIIGAFSHLFSFILFPAGVGGYTTYILFKAGVLVMLALMALGMGYRNLQLRKEKEIVLQQNLENQARINQRLLQLDHVKDQFLANTSHELRTPLNGIIGLAESLRDGVAGPLSEAAKNHLNMIATSGRRLNNLVNDILDFSKLKGRGLELDRRAVDLRETVNVVLSLSQPLVQDKDLQLINAVPDQTPSILADENRLQQILHNLVANGIKFTEAGEVRVGIRKEQEEDQELNRIKERRRLTIYVADTGVGIPAEKKDIIFRAFEQGDGSAARSFGGTGLGLAVTRQLVELHDGRIWVESQEGEGATFFFTLPLAEEKDVAENLPDTGGATVVDKGEKVASKIIYGQTDQEKPAAAASSEPLMEVAPAKRVPANTYLNWQTDGEGHPIHILVVDDEPINRQVLENQISLAGYEVQTASGGAEALSLLQNGQAFDLVILDIMMPKMSGYEVCHRLRKTFLPSELPVILLTAKNHVSDLVEGFEAGANDYLTKPFLRDELLSRIRTHLQLSRISKATGRFVPHEFLQTLGKRDITDVRLGDHQEREVTVMFADIRDYTTLAELMTPEDNFQFVNAYAGRMGPVIQEYGGFVQQYLGDAVMAIFQESPEEALKAAIAMQGTILAYNKERAQKGRRAIRVGMGLHTGSLILGIIGDHRRTDAATIADTVNTASRLEGLTKHYGANIILSEDSRRLLPDPDAFHFRYLGRVQVKGKHQPVAIFECIDGDEPEVMARKLATQEDFEQGLRHYFRKEFEASRPFFEAVLKKNAHDTSARLYLHRASAYMDSGVPDNWTGVEMMTHK